MKMRFLNGIFTKTFPARLGKIFHRLVIELTVFEMKSEGLIYFRQPVLKKMLHD